MEHWDDADKEETGSYRLAVSPDVPDDGRTPEGRPRALRYKSSARGDETRLNLDELRHEAVLDEHQIDLENLYSLLQTDPDLGLTPEQVAELFLRDGPNLPVQYQTESECSRFFRCLFGGVLSVLWLGGIFCILAQVIDISLSYTRSSYDYIIIGLVLIIMAFISGIFTYIINGQEAKIVAAFKNMISDKTTVIRNGDEFVIPSDNLVVGDLVELNRGDRVPADIRIISSSGLKVDNSSVTGESEPASRTPECTSELPLETKNLAFFGTNCVEGSGRGIVISTGERTILGRTAELSGGLEMGEGPLSREMMEFTKYSYIQAAFFGVILFTIGFFRGLQWIDALIFFVGFMVAYIPEGLLPTISSVLSVSIKRISQKNVIVKSFEAIETLGSTSVLIVDKTGTITQNRMTVSHLWLDGEILEAGIIEDQGEGPEFDKNSPGWNALSRCAMLCSKAKFKGGQDDVKILKRDCAGDASDAAILKFMELYVSDVMGYRARSRKVCEIPFNSTNKFHVTIHETNDYDSSYLLCMKGAPERILERSSTIFINGEERRLNEELKMVFRNAYSELGGIGERVIGFCDYKLPIDRFPPGYLFDSDDINFPLENLRFIGLVSMIDPPRPSVPDAIDRCRSAGIKVIMVTGDHPITAKAIARSIGVISHGNETIDDIAARVTKPVEEVDPRLAKACVIHGDELREMNSDQLDDILRNHSEIVFARTSPQQKLIIVEGCQRLDAIVAVTGDGVNDSPALKKADIGVAMGVSGSDVSKQAADMILLDDNFASIVTGVEEGRLIFDNLKKSIAYTLTSKLPEIIPFVFFIVFNVPLPLGAITILCIDLGTDMVPAISLGYEKEEQNIMKRKPRNVKTEKLVTEQLVTKAYGHIGMIQVAAAFFTYFIIMAENGFLPWDVFNLRRYWDAPSIHNLRDSYGQEWSYHDRKVLEYTCHTGFFLSIVVLQWANLIICKTRRKSIFRQGMGNHVLNFGLIFETALALFLCYCPGMDVLFRLYPINILWCLPALFFSLLIFLYDEVRRLIIRRNPGGWLEAETYY